jgi:tetrahedral aminopeptidase
MNTYKIAFLIYWMGKANEAVLEKLVQIFGPTGCGKFIQSYYAEIMAPYVDKIYSDNMGNCYAEISGDEKIPKIMMNAHADTVGFIIKHIDDRGFVFAQDISGFPVTDYQMLPGTEVVVYSRFNDKMVSGHFIPIVPLHHKTDLDEPLDRNHLLIDFGVEGTPFTEEGKDNVEKHINIGDYAVIKPNCRRQQLNEDHFVSTNLDDRAGLYCMYRIAKTIKDSGLKNGAPITFVSTIREEDWTEAARVAAELVSPRYSLTIDVTPATDTIRGTNEDFIAQKYGNTNLGKGFALPRGPGVDDELFLFIEKLCRRKINPKFESDYQVEISDAGSAENFQILQAKFGVKACGIYIPCRNTHSLIETVSLWDLETVRDLGREFYEQISSGKYNNGLE